MAVCPMCTLLAGCCLLGRRLARGDMIILDLVGGFVRDWFMHPTNGLYVRHDDFEFVPWMVIMNHNDM